MPSERDKVSKKPRIRRYVLCAFAYVLGLWILTLGSHVEREVRQVFSVSDAINWQELISGKSKVAVNGFLAGSHHKSSGVPYLLFYRTDVAPYQIQLTVKTLPSLMPTEVSVSQVAIEENGTTTNLLNDGAPLTAGFREGRLMGNAILLASIPAEADLGSSSSSCEVTVTGIVHGNDDFAFEQSLTIPIERRTHRYLGWYRLLYLSGF